MKQGKYQKNGTSMLSIKSISLVLALVLMVGCVAGGTVAWLMTQTQAVVNTFTYGDINITLKETDTLLDDTRDDNTNDYKMIPGETITKDPTITVEANSEACWLYVELKKSSNFDYFMTYEMDSKWTALPGVDGVYFCKMDATTADTTVSVLKDNKVSVKTSITKEDLNALDPDGKTPTYPNLTVTAYAVQYSGFNPEVSEGATESTAEQINAAALKAWNDVVNATN